MMKRKGFFLAAVMVFALALPAAAHFQMVYTPDTVLEKGGTIPLKAVFTHPFEAGHTMDMGHPEAFFVVHKEKETDLMKGLKPISWSGLENSARAFETEFTVRSMGDYVFCLVPSPYFEKLEDSYIQQITKVMVNNGGLPTDWDREIGLKAEIVPLDKPYALWTGNVFRGIVKGGGKAVPFAEVEVEYLNHDPQMDRNAFGKAPHVEAPSDVFVTLTIKANESGEFVFGIPRAGWWGFCALGVGPDGEYKGKELSQDAVLWVQARDMK